MFIRCRSPLVVMAFALLAGCMSGAPAKPESRIDPNANIPALTTFGWQPANSNLVSTDLTQRKFDEAVRAAIVTDLTRKGYANVDKEPDLLVAYEISPYEKT